VIHFKLKEIQELFKRRYKLLNIGMEVITRKNKTFFIAFASSDERDTVYNAMKANVEKDCITAE
jgi:hypothetical protein